MNVLSLFCEKRKTEGSSRRVFSRLQITFEADSSLSLSLSFSPLSSLLSTIVPFTFRHHPLVSTPPSLFSSLFSFFPPLHSFYQLLLSFVTVFIYTIGLSFEQLEKSRSTKDFCVLFVQYRVMISRNHHGNFPLSKIDRVRKQRIFTDF